MNNEEKTRGCMAKAQTLKASGNYKDAVTALQSLSEYGDKWGPVYVSALELLAELCFSQEQGITVDRFFPAFRWNRKKLRGSQHLEEGTRRIVEITLRHFREMGERARLHAKRMEESPTQEEVILAALSGVSLERRAKERYLISAENIMQMVGSELLSFNVIGQSKKLLPIYLDTASQLIAYCQENNLKRVIGRVADAYVRFFKRFLFAPILPPSRVDNQYLIVSKELEIDRADFYKEKTTAESAVQVFCQLLKALAALGNWDSAWTTLQCFTKVLQEVIQQQDSFRESRIGAYLAMSDVFWKCSHYAFHAYFMGLVAYLTDGEKQAGAASSAVLATLCVPNTMKERNSFARGSDSLFEKNTRISQLFGFQSPPGGAFLWHRLQRMGVLQKALPGVQVLDKLLRSNAMDENLAKKAMIELSVITQQEPSLQMYHDLLCKVIIQRYLECMATKTTHMEMSSLQIGEDQSSEDAYINVIEPFILHESGIPVEIDHMTKSILFKNTTKERVLQAFETLAEQVDLQPPAPRRKIDITIEHLQRAHDRSSILHRLQQLCVENAEARRRNAKEKEEAELENLRLERIMLEEKKREAARLAQEERAFAEYQRHVNQEQQNKVLQRLKEKYKGFSVPVNLAQKNSTEFVQELTRLLSTHLKKVAQEKMADVTKMNNFERACRELEIPRRKALELKEAEQHKAERAAARENILAQHRKEFEKRQRDNIILKKFLREAEKYVEQIQLKEKTSKRDEQQMLLQKEMERLQGL